VFQMQAFWRPGALRLAMVEIVKALMRRDSFPDQIDFTKIANADRNAIGTAFRILMRRGLIEPTGQWRRSQAHDRRGSKVFCYRVKNVNFASEFLRRFSPSTQIGQVELFQLPAKYI